MAIYPKLAPHLEPTITSADASMIEAWTEHAAEALHGLSLSASTIPLRPAAIGTTGTRGTAVKLTIPLDDHERAVTDDNEAVGPGPSTATHTVYRRREPIRRDSLKRREALLKGKEGSRRRQRWENDRLLSNPWVQPPLPSDWEVRPTHPVHHVPYYLAPLWDAREVKKSKSASLQSKKGSEKAAEDPAARVPKEVRQKLKRAKAAKGLLQDLEEEVRKFVEGWNEKEKSRERDGFGDIDSDEEEIVFIGRNGKMHDSPTRERFHDDLAREKLVFDGLADDHGASFGRWLVHSIGTYYGLKTWSVTVGNPARREAYVGINETKKPGGQLTSPTGVLPRPLYGMV